MRTCLQLVNGAISYVEKTENYNQEFVKSLVESKILQLILAKIDFND